MSGPAVSMERHELQKHIFWTYLSLRYGLAAIGGALPIVVLGVAWFHGVELQGSLSAYYWAPGAGLSPSRNWFVGGLFAVAACLYLYKGFTTPENIALNLAAIFGVGVAVVPTEWDCEGKCARFTVHGASAVLLFLCLFYVVWCRARDTLNLLSDPAAEARYRMLYRIIGAVMLASPLTAWLVNVVLGGRWYVLLIEVAGIWAFAAYWMVKSTELSRSKATSRALDGAVEVSPAGKAIPVPASDAPRDRVVAAE